jgi:hypothetical protein
MASESRPRLGPLRCPETIGYGSLTSKDGIFVTTAEGGHPAGVSPTGQGFLVVRMRSNCRCPELNLGLGAFKEMMSGLLGGFPDLRLTIDHQIVARDKDSQKILG